jgi:hypothetical protein
MHIIELAERGARAAPVDLILSHLAEEDEIRPLQGLGDPGGVDDVVERCVQVHDGDVRGVLLWEWSVLLWQRMAFERRARGARLVAALLISQGHHFDHGAKVTAFTATQASIAERVEDIGYLLREGLGDIEVVAVDVEEGATAKAIPEVVPLMQSRVPNLQTRPEATLSPGIDGDPGQNLIPLATALCSTVGANYHGNLETVAMGRLIEGAQRW